MRLSPGPLGFRHAVQLLTVLILAVYWRVQDFGFINFDDPFFFTHNPHVLGGLTLSGLKWAVTETAHNGFWTPIFWLSLMADVELFQGHAGGTHLVNLLFHLANTILLLFILQRMTGDPWKSLLAAALFSLHPLRVEAVVWIVERKEVLSAFFGLLALWHYVRFTQRLKTGVGYDHRRVWLNYGTALLFFAMSLACKPMWVTLPFLLLLLDFWPLSRLAPGRGRMIFLEKVPFFLVSFLFAVLTLKFSAHTGALFTLERFPIAWRLTHLPFVYLAYGQKTFWPLNLAAFYPHPATGPTVVKAVAIFLAMLAATGIGWRFCRTRPALLVGWLWFLGTLVPVSGIITSGSNQLMADRFTYLPHIGLAMGIVWGLSPLPAKNRVSGRPAAGVLALLVILLMLAGLTWQQVGVWRSSETLWQQAIRTTKNNAHAHALLGNHYVQTGELEKAIPLLEKAVALKPSGLYYLHLGTALHKQGKADAALDAFRAGLSLDPDSSILHSQAGIVMLNRKQFRRAALLFQKAIEKQLRKRDRYYHVTFHNLGLALTGLGHLDDGARFLEKALKEDPQNRAWRCQEAAALFGATPQKKAEFPGAADRIKRLCARYTP